MGPYKIFEKLTLGKDTKKEKKKKSGEQSIFESLIFFPDRCVNDLRNIEDNRIKNKRYSCNDLLKLYIFRCTIILTQMYFKVLTNPVYYVRKFINVKNSICT